MNWGIVGRLLGVLGGVASIPPLVSYAEGGEGGLGIVVLGVPLVVSAGYSLCGLLGYLIGWVKIGSALEGASDQMSDRLYPWPLPGQLQIRSLKPGAHIFKI